MNSLSEFPESLPLNISKNELKCYECFRHILYVFFKILSYFLLSGFFLPLLVFLWLKSCFAKDTLRSNSLSRDWMERGPSQIFVMYPFSASLLWMSLVFGGLKEYSKILQVLWAAEELKVGSKAFWAYYIFFEVDVSISEKKFFTSLITTCSIY